MNHLNIRPYFAVFCLVCVVKKEKMYYNKESKSTHFKCLDLLINVKGIKQNARLYNTACDKRQLPYV
ncbi:UNVERIFIED_CONTAM: hypothetical protein Cloal_3836 [Acetivibrio alkalicellulosi]